VRPLRESTASLRFDCEPEGLVVEVAIWDFLIRRTPPLSTMICIPASLLLATKYLDE
jgi:hypothetical protein